MTRPQRLKDAGAAIHEAADRFEIIPVLNWFEELTRLVPTGR